MWYDLSSSYEKEQFVNRAYELSVKGSVVELTEKKQKRTIPQNAYLHLILGAFAMSAGETLDWVKREYFKKYCNRELFVLTRYDERIGKQVEYIRSSRDLDTAEMTKAIDNFKRWSEEECDIPLPDADNKGWLWEIEKEMQKIKHWI
ncbi:MAG: hypothetical protein IJF63_04805 [Alistipes sp.]|nr:hypothetical protein [Alistipes sp.]MBQ6862240.1 hypothetical protein [Alistipes sp.]